MSDDFNLDIMQNDADLEKLCVDSVELINYARNIVVKHVNIVQIMDYRNESQVTADIRWNDRITYDGTWENNLFNFFTKVTPKLTEDLKKPFKLEGGVQRIDIHQCIKLLEKAL